MVGPYPGGIVYNPSNGLLYVANTGGPSNTVSVINPSTKQVTNLSIGNPTPYNFAYDPQYKEMYIAAGNAPMEIIQGMNVVGLVGYENPTQGHTCGANEEGFLSIAYDSANGRLYAVCGSENDVVEIKPVNSTYAIVTDVIVTSGTGPGQSGITYDPNDNLLFIAATNAVIVLDPSTNSITHMINDSAPCGNGTFCNENQILYNPSNSMVYVDYEYNRTVGEIACINTKTFVMDVCIPSVAQAVGGLVYDLQNKLVYVANAYNDMVSAINGTKIVTNCSLPAVPNLLAYDPANGNIYATGGNNYVYQVTPSAKSSSNSASYSLAIFSMYPVELMMALLISILPPFALFLRKPRKYLTQVMTLCTS